MAAPPAEVDAYLADSEQNAKIRLINRRGYGHPNPHHLAAMIHLCLGGITIPLPTQT